VAAAAPLVDERLQWLLHLRMRGVLPMVKGEGSEDYGNKSNEESKGVEGDEGEGDKGDDGNFPKGGGRQWTQQSPRY
jgi:hypothetical protein